MAAKEFDVWANQEAASADARKALVDAHRQRQSALRVAREFIKREMGNRVGLLPEWEALRIAKVLNTAGVALPNGYKGRTWTRKTVIEVGLGDW